MSGETRSFVLLRQNKNRRGGATNAPRGKREGIMPEKKKGGNTVNTVWELAAPIAQRLGLILWDVKFLKEGANWYLRIIIDKEGGVGIDDCVAMNDALEAPLDEADPIEQSYNLQISSAGIERELVRDFHFQMFLGADVTVKFRTAVGDAKVHKCVLKGYEDGRVTVAFPDGTDYTFDKKDASSIRLDDFDPDF